MEINNNTEYLSRMTKTFLDKSYFLKYIPSGITTIIDYGCADGSFLEFIRNICKDSFRYIGIETNPDFANMAKERGFEVYDSDSFLFSMKKEEQLRCCICLSSVIHELYSYIGTQKTRSLMKGLSVSNFGCVAIRDMGISYYEKPDNYMVSNAMIEFLNEVIVKNNVQLKDFVSENGIHNVKDMFHFLLKYMYVENWDREVRECYLWNENNLDHYLKHTFNESTGWNTIIAEKFFIPYLREKWHNDFETKKNRNLEKLINSTFTHFKLIVSKIH